MDKTRVVIISGSFPNIRCGVGDHVEKLIENLLLKEKIDISLLTSSDVSIIRREYAHALIKKWNVFSLIAIVSFLKKKKPDLINLHTPTVAYKSILTSISFLPLLSKIFLKPIPFVVTVHDYGICKKYLKIFYLSSFLFSDLIIVTNDEDLKAIIKNFPFLKKKLRKIYMGPTIEMIGISHEEEREYYKKVSYRKGDRFITTFGIIKKDRHVDVIIKAFHRLCGDDNSLKLTVLGDTPNDDSRHRNYLLRIVEELGLRNKVYCLGFCNPQQISFYLSISDLSILLYEKGASFRRGSLINCIVRKIPVLTNISRRYNAERELIDSGVVLAIDSLDIEEICKKARIILYDRDCSDRIKKKMEETKKIFSWQSNIDKIMSIYSELLRKDI